MTWRVAAADDGSGGFTVKPHGVPTTTHQPAFPFSTRLGDPHIIIHHKSHIHTHTPPTQYTQHIYTLSPCHEITLNAILESLVLCPTTVHANDVARFPPARITLHTHTTKTERYRPAPFRDKDKLIKVNLGTRPYMGKGGQSTWNRPRGVCWGGVVDSGYCKDWSGLKMSHNTWLVGTENGMRIPDKGRQDEGGPSG